MNDDLNYIKILSAFHYVVAAIAALFASFPIIHLLFGISMLTGNLFEGNPEPSFPFPFTLFGLFFTAISATIILLGWAFAVCLAIAGSFLSQRKRYTFCLVMAGVSCIFIPFGTVLGVFTIIILLRQSVKELFRNQPQGAAG